MAKLQYAKVMLNQDEFYCAALILIRIKCFATQVATLSFHINKSKRRTYIK